MDRASQYGRATGKVGSELPKSRYPAAQRHDEQ